MKNLELLPLSPEETERIKFEVLQYRRFAHVFIEIAKIDGKNVFLRIEQKGLVAGRLLGKSELYERAEAIFKDVLPGYTIHISPAYFNRDDIEKVDAAWFTLQCEKYAIKLRKISTYTDIDSSTLATLRGGSKPMTKWHKVALYYFFKYYDIVNNHL